MKNRMNHFFKQARWVLVLVLMAVFVQTNTGHSGPGTDTAVSSNRDMCSLPPFLNVAVTERPNIMLLYDNSTSMALQAYNKEYDPGNHYYGLFNSDTCYKNDTLGKVKGADVYTMFTKDPIFPEEVVEVVQGGKTIGVTNPALKTDANISNQHNILQHFCTKTAYPFSGNFMNWATMRRIDLLRRAFTFGDGTSGSGLRSAASVQGEQAFTPCYNKSYTSPLTYTYTDKDGVSHTIPADFAGATQILVVPPTFGNNIAAKVVGGNITFGFSCPAGTSVTSELKPKYRPGKTSEFAALDAKKKAERSATVDAQPLLQGELSRLFNHVEAPQPASVDAPYESGIQVASLFNVMNDSGAAVLGAAAAPDLSLLSWTITTTAGAALTNAYLGEVVRITATVKNIGNKDFTGTAASILKLTIATDAGVNQGSTSIPASSPASCEIGTISKLATAATNTKTITCDFTVPATWLSTDFPVGSYIGLYVNPSNSPSESGSGVNNGTAPFYIVEAEPDLRAVPFTVTRSGTILTIDFTVVNAGTETGTFPVKFYGSANNVLDLTDPELVSASADCVAPRTALQGETLTYSCTVDLATVCTAGLGVAPCLDGTYYLFLSIDPLKETSPAESTRDNNINSSSFTIGTPATAELGLTAVNIPAAVLAGGYLDIQFRVVNAGDTDSGPYSVRVSLDGVLLNTCAGVSVTDSTTTAVASCGFTVPPPPPSGTMTAGAKSVTIEIVYLDTVPGNNVVNGTTNVTISSSICSLVTSCVYAINVDFFGRRRTGLLWQFNSKEIGRTAPANMGLSKFTDWDVTNKGFCSGAGCTSNEFGGVEDNQSNANNQVAHLEKAAPTGEGRLARVLLNVLNYYQRKANFYPAASEDPLLYDPIPTKNGKTHPCRKNYILYITDGISYNDDEVLDGAGFGPDLSKYSPDLSDPTEINPQPMLDTSTMNTFSVPNGSALPIMGTNGTYHLDNVALYGNIVDQRNLAAFPGTDSVQTIFVHTFADAGTNTVNYERSTRLIRRAAINGSFHDKDGDGLPSSPEEYDANGDGIPDGYFQAKEGDDLGQVILNALNSILLKTASGTSVSVIASTSRGEGAIYQSYFRPVTIESGVELNWLGFLQALWVDKYNNLREDSDTRDGVLKLDQDKIIDTEFDASRQETVAYLWTDTNADGVKDPGGRTGPFPLTRIQPIFEGGKILHATAPADRTIYSWPHWSTEATPPSWPLYFQADQVDACTAGAPCLKKHLFPGTYYNDVSVTTKLVNWVRGEDQADISFRQRTAVIDGVSGTWKLGDIVYSTPTVVGAPEERYDLLYGSKQDGYSNYFTYASNRRRLVLIGANDGMMHAFNGGVFRDGDNGTGSVAWFDPQGVPLGKELWAYIPGSLLPNLRMLADSAYDIDCHISYVDLKPKVTDVQVFFDTAGMPLDGHPYGWGTIMIGGMRLGCGKSQYSSYFVLDITNPDVPWLMTEVGHDSHTTAGFLDAANTVNNLNSMDFTTFYPIVMHVDDPTVVRLKPDGSTQKPGRWFIMMGSGPEQKQFNSAKTTSALYTFDLNVLGERTDLTTPISRTLESFTKVLNRLTVGVGTVAMPPYTIVANGLTGDLDANFSVDVAYLVTQTDDDPTNLLPGARWKSSVWRLNTTPKGAAAVSADPFKWEIREFFNTPAKFQPQTAAPGLSRDNAGNIWLYFGTGRFMYHGGDGEKIDDVKYGEGLGAAYRQGLMGVIDSCWDNPVSGLQTISSRACPALPLNYTNLADVTDLDLWLDTANKSNATVQCSGTCNVCAGGCTRSSLISDVASGTINGGTGTMFGWYRTLQADPTSTKNELSFNKPAVAGGYVLFTTYLPAIDQTQCTISGRAYLYIMDFQTGIGALEDPFGSFVSTSTATQQKIQVIGDIGTAAPSPPSIFGKQIFVQGSNAKITGIQTNANFKLLPRIRGWQEQ